MERLIALLSTVAVEVRKLEGEASRLLYDLADQQGYTRQLRHKAVLLSGLADAVAELGPLPPEIDALVRERIGSFSFEADRAIRVDSVFYMSVLLWPEEAKPGETNELEALIRLLQDQHQPQVEAPALPGNPGGQGQPPSR